MTIRQVSAAPTALPLPFDSHRILEPLALDAIRDGLRAQFFLLTGRLCGPADGFFEAGGDSLRAMQLQLFVQREWGHVLKFGTIHKFPSWGQLSTVVYKQLRAETRPEIFRLRPAENPRGLLAFTDTMGYDFLDFLLLARHVDPAFDVVYVEWKDLDRDRYMRPQVEEFAGRYAALLEEYAGDLPVLLAGACDGAVMALETARAWKGAQLPRVMIFDTRAFAHELREAAYYGRRLRGFLKRPLREKVAKFKKHLRMAGDRFRAPFSVGVRLHGPPLRKSWLGGMRLAPFDGDLVLMRAADSQVQLRGESDLGWPRLISGSFQKVVVAGDHYSMFEEPHVRTLAKKIDQILKEIAAYPRPPHSH